MSPFAAASAQPLALLALAALTLGGILTTAIQPHVTSASFSPEALAALPALTAKDYLFGQPELRAKVGETVVSPAPDRGEGQGVG